MRFRKLRIAWTVGCGIACVLLIVLWVRSYSGGEALALYESGLHAASVSSTKGRIELLEDNNINANPYEWVDFVMDRDSGRHIAFAIFSGFQSRHTNRFDSLSIPHWFAVALAATLAATPWLRWRFQPSHSANRHYARCRGAGAGGLGSNQIVASFTRIATLEGCVKMVPGTRLIAI